MANNDPTNEYGWGFFGGSNDIQMRNNGTGSINPTLTRIYISDTKSSFSDAPLVVTNTNTAPNSVTVALAPNIATTNVMYSMLGQAVTTGNALALGFKYVGNNNSSNDIELGFAGGSPMLVLKNDSTTTISTTSTTNPILTLSSNSSTSNILGYRVSAPSISGGYNIINMLQKNATNGNGGYMKFYYNGNADAANYLSLGVNGITDMMTFNYDGKMYANAVFVLQGTTNQITLDASLASTNYTWKYPATAGLSGQVLSTTGSGTQWVNAATGSVSSVGMTVPTTQFTLSGSPVTTTGTFVLGLNSPQGSGVIVLATSPTLTSATVTDTIASSFTTAPFRAINTNAHPSTIALFMAPNITANDITVKTLGQDTTTGNSVSQYFKWVGSNNSANEYGFGFFGGSNDIVVKKSGVVQLNGTVNTQLINISNPFTVTLSATLLTADYIFKFPNGTGSSGQVLTSLGSGGTQWSNANAGTVTSVRN